MRKAGRRIVQGDVCLKCEKASGADCHLLGHARCRSISYRSMIYAIEEIPSNVELAHKSAQIFGALYAINIECGSLDSFVCYRDTGRRLLTPQQ